jgi:PAS domain S-box-containing protein
MSKKMKNQTESLAAADISRLEQQEKELRRERNFISAILETTGALIVVFDPKGRFLRINRAFETLTGFTILDLVGKYFWDEVLHSKDREPMELIFKNIKGGEFPIEYRGHVLTREKEIRTVIWTLTTLKQDDEDEYVICSGIDITELQDALADIQTLSGLLPICAHCKKIRDDKGYWNQIEEYISRFSDASFSHSLCPDCASKHYKNFKRTSEK